MKYIYTTILFILCNLGFSQNQDRQELELKTENDNWLQSLEKIDSKDIKIRFIIEKIKRDSIIEFQNSSDRIVIKMNKDKNVNKTTINQSKCKILFLLFQKETEYLLDLNKYPNNSVILKYLTSETIYSIEILKDEKATSLYGSRSICGVVVLKSDSKKLKNLIKKSTK